MTEVDLVDKAVDLLIKDTESDTITWEKNTTGWYEETGYYGTNIKITTYKDGYLLNVANQQVSTSSALLLPLWNAIEGCVKRREGRVIQEGLQLILSRGKQVETNDET